MGRALQAVAEATQKSRQECVSPSRKETPLEKVTLTPPPTPSQSEPKSKVASMKGIPSSLLEKVCVLPVAKCYVGPKHYCYIQLRQMKSGIVTWVCTNSPTAPDASVTAKAVCACQTG